MRVLITNSPAYIEDMNRRFTYGSRFACIVPVPYKYKISLYTPYMWSMGYASSLLKRDTTYKVKVIDAQARMMNDKEFKRAVKRYSPDVVIADLPTISFDYTMKLFKELKEDLGFKLIVTGLHVTGLPKETKRDYPFIDTILTGEYELVLKDFLEGKKIKAMKNPFRNIDFDSLPYPDRKDMPPEQYHDMEVNLGLSIQMLTSRGCPSQCTFCNSTVYWKGGYYWQRKAEKVVDEMEYVWNKFNPKSIYFDDDIVKPNMLDGISGEIKKRGLDIKWVFMGDIHIPEKTLRKCASAGCIGLKFGIESINPKVLKSINKSWVRKGLVEKFVKLCKELKLFTHGTFMVGLPNDTKESLLKTMDFFKKLDLDSFQMYTTVAIPGSPFYNQAKRNGWIYKDKWENYDGNIPMMNYPHLSNEELKELTDKWSAFRHHFILKKRLKNPHILLRNLLFYSDFNYLKLKIKNFLFYRGEKPV